MPFAQIKPETVWWMADAFIKEPAIPHPKWQVEMFFITLGKLSLQHPGQVSTETVLLNNLKQKVSF